MKVKNTFCALKKPKNNDFIQIFISFSVGLDISRSETTQRLHGTRKLSIG